jgi:molybdopterin biosynthesis enzyme
VLAALVFSRKFLRKFIQCVMLERQNYKCNKLRQNIAKSIKNTKQKLAFIAKIAHHQA